jgi:hypothetical protein
VAETETGDPQFRSTLWTPVLDKKVRVVASVRRSGVKVAVDGRVIIDWKGDARRSRMNSRNRPMPRPGLSVGTWDSRFAIHGATLVEIK